jgi:hypothetical protein
MSVTITMLLVYKSIAFRYNTVNPNSIIYYTPINSIGKSLLIGILVNMFINNLYSLLSIPIISTIMIFSNINLL